MLHHRSASCRQNEHDRGRNVEKAETVPASATNVDHWTRHFGRIDRGIDRAFHQHLNEPGDFVSALAFAMQHGKKLCFLFITDLIGKKQRDGKSDIAAVQINAGLKFVDRLEVVQKTAAGQVTLTWSACDWSNASPRWTLIMCNGYRMVCYRSHKDQQWCCST